MSMEMTWLDFQLSADNQNGHHLLITCFFYFLQISLETWYIYRFSESASLLALSVSMCDWKWGYDGHLDLYLIIPC